jgi:lysophospholipase L1-like esterase
VPIPNEASATTYPNQADVDSEDFRVVSDAHSVYGVLSGCACSAASSGVTLGVAVAAGVVYAGTKTQKAVVGATVTPAAAHATLPRYDLITVDYLGTLAVVAGTAAAAPVFPVAAAGRVVLAAVYIPAAATSITNTNIVDKRQVVDHAPDPGPGNTYAAGSELRAFRAAMQQWFPARVTFGVPGRTVNVLVLGDSNTVGYYSNNDFNRWTQLLYRTLADQFGMHAPIGFQPHHSITNYNLPWIDTGTVTDNSGSGLGYGAVNIPGTGTSGSTQASQMCDRFWVHYSTGTGLGAFTITLDGTVVATISAVAATRAGGVVWDSGPLQRGFHQVKITPTTTTAAVLEGITWFDGNGPLAGAAGAPSQANARTGYGVRLWNASKFGSAAADFAATAATWWTDGLGLISPDLVIISWGTNEQTAGTAAATFKTNLSTVISRINTVLTTAAVPLPSYMLVSPHGAGPTAAAIEPYTQVMAQLARENNYAFLDRNELMGWVDSDSVDPGGLGSPADGASGRKHLSDVGNGLAAAHTADLVLAGVRPVPQPKTNADKELRALRAAWAKRAAKPVNLVVVGDSITQGYYATTFDQSLMQVLMARLCQANGQPVPAGYVPMTSISTGAYTGRLWTLTSVTDSTNYGIGYGAGTLAASGVGIASISATCDRFWIHYPQAASGLGAFSISIDGGGATTVTPTGTARGGRVWDSGQLTRDVHSVTITTTTATAAVVEGVTFFDGNGNTSGTVGTLTAANADTGAGLRIFNAAHFGYTAGNYATSPNGVNWWTDGLDMVAPDAVVIVLGVNDCTTVFENQFHNDLYNVINRIRLAATTNAQLMPSIVIVSPFGVGASSSDAMPPHREIMRQVAAETGSAFVDLYDVMGYVGTAAADVYVLMSALDSSTNKIHPSDIGHQMIGDYLSEYVISALGPTGQIPRSPTRRVKTAGRTVADGVLASNTTVTSATASFQTTDVGKSIIGVGIPAGTTITARASTTSITISAAATLTVTGVGLSIMTAIPAVNTTTDDALIVDCTAGPADIQMPSPVSQAGQIIRMKKTDNTVNRVRLWISGSTNKIEDGAEMDLVTDGNAVDFQADGVNWVVF